MKTTAADADEDEEKEGENIGVWHFKALSLAKWPKSAMIWSEIKSSLVIFSKRRTAIDHFYPQKFIIFIFFFSKDIFFCDTSSAVVPLQMLNGSQWRQQFTLADNQQSSKMCRCDCRRLHLARCLHFFGWLAVWLVSCIFRHSLSFLLIFAGCTYLVFIAIFNYTNVLITAFSCWRWKL